MSETQELNIPEAVSIFASSDGRVTLNNPVNGHRVSEELTNFILDTPQGTKIAILFRNPQGRIFLLIGTFHDVRTRTRTEFKSGMDAEILLEETKHRRPENTGITLASSILAIAPLGSATRPAFRTDPDGSIFISMLAEAP